MTKSEFVDELLLRSGDIKTKAEAIRIVDDFLGIISDKMAARESVQFVGFGTFEVSERAAREGVNPQTKEKIQIEAKVVPHFKAGKTLKERVK